MSGPWVMDPNYGRIEHGEVVPGLLSKTDNTPIHALIQPYGFGLYDEQGRMVGHWQAPPQQPQEAKLNGRPVP